MKNRVDNPDRTHIPSPLFVSHAYEDADKIPGLRLALPEGIELIVFPKRPADPEAPVSGEIVSKIHESEGLVYLTFGESDDSTWVRFETDYARRAGKPVYSFDTFTSELAPVDVEPVVLGIIATASPKNEARARRLLDWMASERNFVVSELDFVNRVKEILIHYDEVIRSRRVALWLLDEKVAALINVLATQYLREQLEEQYDEPLPPPMPYLLARIDPEWQSITSPDPEDQAAAESLYPTQHFLDLCSAETADEFNWNRVDDLIVELTVMCIGSADIDREDEVDWDEEDTVETEWAYPYWCVP